MAKLSKHLIINYQPPYITRLSSTWQHVLHFFIAICTCCTHIKYLCLYQSLLIFHKKQNHDYLYLYVQKCVVAIFISAYIDNPTVHSDYHTPYSFSVHSVRQPLQKFVKDTPAPSGPNEVVSLTPQPPPCLGGKVLRDKEKPFYGLPEKNFSKNTATFFSQKKKNSFPHPSIGHNMYAWIWAYMYCYRYASKVSHTSLRLPLQRLWHPVHLPTLIFNHRIEWGTLFNRISIKSSLSFLNGVNAETKRHST